nr:MAG TPA: hypothetical protein [Caudoviricetes sp.]
MRFFRALRAFQIAHNGVFSRCGRFLWFMGVI